MTGPYVYKLSQSKEAPFFEAYWGEGSLGGAAWRWSVSI